MHLQRAAVLQHDGARDREPQSAVAPVGARREHRLEDTRELGRRDARSRVRHLHLHARRSRPRHHADATLAIRVHERFLGIHQQIRHGLVQLDRIAGDRRQLLPGGELDDDAMLAPSVAVPFDGATDQGVHVHAPTFAAGVRGVPGGIEQQRHDPRGTARLLTDLFNGPTVLRQHGRRGGLQLRDGQQARQRVV